MHFALGLARLSDPVMARGSGLGELVANIVMGVLHHVFGGLQAALTCVALRSTQRAEYHADVAASRAAGTGATTELLDALVTSDVMHTAVRRAARLDPAPVSWQASAQAARAEIDPLLPRLRQLSLRDEASLLQTHPPSGLRVRMLHVSEPQVASVVLTDERADRIDVELASSYGLARRDMVHV
jgi:Zn-dependent protease with chaperone function